MDLETPRPLSISGVLRLFLGNQEELICEPSSRVQLCLSNPGVQSRHVPQGPVPALPTGKAETRALHRFSQTQLTFRLPQPPANRSLLSVSYDGSTAGLLPLQMQNPRIPRADCKGLEHPRIWVSKDGPGTNPLRIPRDACIRSKLISFLFLK